MSMKIVRVGATRLVMTMMRPCFSTTNKRFVSPGGAVMQIGLENTRLGKAFVGINPRFCASADTAVKKPNNITLQFRRVRKYLFMLNKLAQPSKMSNGPARFEGAEKSW